MTPVYEQAYEEWEGEPRGPAHRIWAIVSEGWNRSVSSKWVWALWIATLVHVGVRGVILYYTGQVDPTMGSQFSKTFLADAMGDQVRWVLLLMLAIVASGALARDLDAGALSFYFSKPITPLGYAIGKVAPAFLIGLSVTAVPLLVIWSLGVAFTPDLASGVYWWPFQILGASIVVSLAAALVAIALSGLLRSTTMAAGAWVGLGLLSAAVARILVGITERARLEMVDVLGAFNTAGSHVMGATAADAFTGTAWAVTAGWAVASGVGIAYVLASGEVTG